MMESFNVEEKNMGIEFCRSGKRHRSKPSWSEENPEGRWRSFDYEELVKRDKISPGVDERLNPWRKRLDE